MTESSETPSDFSPTTRGHAHPGDQQPAPVSARELAQNAADFKQQSEKLSHQQPSGPSSSFAVEAEFVTPKDPVIVNSDGNRLPGVPLREAHKLNVLHEEVQRKTPETVEIKEGDETKEKISNTARHNEGSDDSIDASEKHKVIQIPPSNHHGRSMQKPENATLDRAIPQSHTHPLFPPLPLYGPPSFLRNAQCVTFRLSSFFGSLAFLGVIVWGALLTNIPELGKRIFYKLTMRNLDANRPFYQEEIRRAEARKKKNGEWKHREASGKRNADQEGTADEFPPTEGGPDPIICDVGYYARRVGLDVEEFKVQTEDGFMIDLWHVYDPKEYTRLDPSSRAHHGPDIFQGSSSSTKRNHTDKKPKYPLLLIHGLLQSSGAYCCTDDDSLAFWLCKSGYDVWLGNNRCGFEPKHALLEPTDPRMWCWNIRQMGVFDLPALTSRVLAETGFAKLGLVAHSQGTTQTFVALAKEQRPDLGEKLSVFCALAPAAYAGPLIGKTHFRFMKVISPAVFSLVFGIHAFIPFMMQMHALLNARLYGWLGYNVFSFLFDWSDKRWDRGLRDRMFQFSPVYVSSESMRWWLGRDCFARHKCILETKEVVKEEERMDAHDAPAGEAESPEQTPEQSPQQDHSTPDDGFSSWYDAQAPPFAIWACGNDNLVDGRKLLRRFEKGREPHVQVVHSSVIDGYEHLDVIWAMDAVEQVFKGMREVLWKTCPARDVCRVPEGCEGVPVWSPEPGSEEGAGPDSGLGVGLGLDREAAREKTSGGDE